MLGKIYCYILICRCMQKHIQHNNDEWIQFFRKIYLLLYWKDCVWEMSWRLNRTATYWPPPTLLAITVFISRSPAGPSLCWDMVLIPAASLQLIWTSCRRGYIIILRPPTSCERHICTQFNPLTVKVIPDIFDRMHLLFTQVHFFFWQLGRGQYATLSCGNKTDNFTEPLHIINPPLALH